MVTQQKIKHTTSASVGPRPVPCWTCIGNSTSCMVDWNGFFNVVVRPLEGCGNMLPSLPSCLLNGWEIHVLSQPEIWADVSLVSGIGRFLSSWEISFFSLQRRFSWVGDRRWMSTNQLKQGGHSQQDEWHIWWPLVHFREFSVFSGSLILQPPRSA